MNKIKKHVKKPNDNINKTNKPKLKTAKFGLFVFIFFLSINSFAYNIRVEITNCPDYYIYFGKHHGPDFEVLDSIVAKNDLVEFIEDRDLETGVYFIVIPPQTRFDFIIAGNQNFVLKTDTRDILGQLEISGEMQYSVFIDLQRDIAKINKQRTQLKMEKEFYKMYQKDTIPFIQTKIDSLNNRQFDIYTIYKTQLDSTDFLYKILNILEPFTVPDSIQELQYKNPSSHYRYYAEHYLDRVDFNDPSLLNTPSFIFHKILCFLQSSQRSTSINKIYQRPATSCITQKMAGFF